MNSLLVLGTRIVVLALISYTIGIIAEQKSHRVANTVLGFISVGILMDITSTLFMILGSTNSPFTFHGFLGYSALLAMLIDAFLLWKYRIGHRESKTVPQSLHLYSRFAYLWWLVAFVTGSLIVILK